MLVELDLHFLVLLEVADKLVGIKERLNGSTVLVAQKKRHP